MRSWTGNDPIRIVLDRTSKIPNNYHLLSDGIKTIVFSDVKHINDSYGNVIFENLNFNKNVPKQICEVLYTYEIQSIIVEGGKQTIQSFIDANLWDEAYIFKGDTFFWERSKSSKIKVGSIRNNEYFN